MWEPDGNPVSREGKIEHVRVLTPPRGVNTRLLIYLLFMYLLLIYVLTVHLLTDRKKVPSPVVLPGSPVSSLRQDNVTPPSCEKGLQC